MIQKDEFYDDDENDFYYKNIEFLEIEQENDIDRLKYENEKRRIKDEGFRH